MILSDEVLSLKLVAVDTKLPRPFSLKGVVKNLSLQLAFRLYLPLTSFTKSCDLYF